MGKIGIYGKKIKFAQGQSIKFPNFEIEYLGERSELVPAFGRDFKYYDFRIVSSGETVSWTSGTGDIAPARFRAGGKDFLLELRMSDKLGKLGSNELVISPAPVGIQDDGKGSSQANKTMGNVNFLKKDKYVIFSAETAGSSLWGKYARFAPTEEETQKAIQILENFLSKQSGLRPLEEYYAQFTGFIDENGEKNIWANFFCDSLGVNWREKLVLIKDGGNCFFNVKVNLDANKVYDFRVNGVA